MLSEDSFRSASMVGITRESAPFEVFFTLEPNADQAVVLIEVSEGRVIKSNVAFREIFHLPNDLTLKFPRFYHLVTELDVGPIREYLASSRAQSPKMPTPVRMLRADHSQFDAEVSAIVFPSEDKAVVLVRPLEVVGAVFDPPLKDACYRQIVECVSDPIYSISGSGIIRYVNPAFERLTGWDRTEWIGRSFFLLTHFEEMPKILHHLALLFLGVPMPVTCFRLATKSGEFVVAEISGFPRMENGKLVEIIGVVRHQRDLPIRAPYTFQEDHWAFGIKNALLGKKQNLLQNIVGGMESAIIVARPDGKIVFANAAADQLFGLEWKKATLDELVNEGGIFVDENYTKPEPEKLPFVRALNGEITERMDLFVENKKVFASKWLSCVSLSLYDDKRVVKGAVTYLQDITEHKRLETALDASQLLYRSLVENLPVAIFRKDRHGRIVFANARFCELLGRSLNELLGKNDFELFPSALAEKYVSDDRKVMETGKIFEDIEESTTPDGKIFKAHVFKGPVYDLQGKISGVQGAAWDVTSRVLEQEERNRLTIALKRSNRELEQFAYVASHDLKEPLRMVASYVKLISDRYIGKTLDGAACEFLNYAIDGAERMRSLIDELLSYSRVDRIDEAVGTVEVKEVVSRALDNLSLAVEEADAKFDIGMMPRVEGRAGQIGRLFENLISNALKFRGASRPEIQLRAIQLDTDWLFSVRDNGIGIAPKDFDRIFMLFQKLHDRHQYPGTGMGLSICKKIVERHGGRIWVESAPERGAAFFFTLPKGHDEAGASAG